MKNKLALEMLQQLVAKHAPQLVRPDMRWQYGLPHAEAPKEPETSPEWLDVVQEEWVRQKAQENMHAIPVAAVIPGKLGGYIAVWGTKSVPVLPDRLGKSMGQDTLVGLVVTRGNKLPGGRTQTSDTFYTFEGAVQETMTYLGMENRRELAADAVDALSYAVSLGDDAEEALTDMYYDLCDILITEDDGERPDA